MYHSSMIDDVQTLRLLQRIDGQLQQWTERYGLNGSPSSHGESVCCRGNKHLGSRVLPPRPAAEWLSGKMDNCIRSSRATDSASGKHEPHIPAALLGRVLALEKQLVSVEEDRMELRKQIQSMERRFSDLLTSHRVLQGEWSALIDRQKRCICGTYESQTSSSKAGVNAFYDAPSSPLSVATKPSGGCQQQQHLIDDPTVRPSLEVPTRRAPQSLSAAGAETRASYLIVDDLRASTTGQHSAAAERRRKMLDHFAQRLASEDFSKIFNFE
ncbi:hypothetical protein TRVL_04925 [Trypanosoma vivax]|uniref:Uncharacterized protein n=1 Tax=Trypanosoma vivax (strain Y486) TaxID=1055687 RepID=G0TX14_TRYVY|nr:hypothetical protein TRVL_04925 [Trypanosoma vivax]CCC48503.1 conserved hypothetical protein [Trypanosoma vivax Y486]